jgi:hypothetical protein
MCILFIITILKGVHCFAHMMEQGIETLLVAGTPSITREKVRLWRDEMHNRLLRHWLRNRLFSSTLG